MNTRTFKRLAFTATSVVCAAAAIAVIEFAPLDVVSYLFAALGLVCLGAAGVSIWWLSGGVFQRADSELPPATARAQCCRAGTPPETGLTKVNLAELQREAHAIAVAKGCWPPACTDCSNPTVWDEGSDDTFYEPGTPAMWYCSDCGIDVESSVVGPIEVRTFGDLIALVHCELSEALEAYREHGLVAQVRCWNGARHDVHLADQTCPDHHNGTKPKGVPSELADVVIRVTDMAEYYGWDLSSWESAQINHPIAEPTFGDWISLIHGSLSLAFAFLCTEVQCTEVQRRTWEDALKGVLRLVNDMAAHHGIDLDEAIEVKMEYNRTRPHRHGGKVL